MNQFKKLALAIVAGSVATSIYAGSPSMVELTLNKTITNHIVFINTIRRSV